MRSQSFFELHDMFFKAVDECVNEARPFSFMAGVDCTGQPAARSTHFYNGESYSRHPGYVVPLTVTMGKQTPAMLAMHNAYNAAPFDGLAFSTCAHQCTNGTTTEPETYYPPTEEKPAMAVLNDMEQEARAMLADSRDYHTLDGAFLLVRDGKVVWLCRQGEGVALDDCERLLCVATGEPVEHAYYLVRVGADRYDMRQTRYKAQLAEGREHPHDICATHFDSAGIIELVKTHKFDCDLSLLDADHEAHVDRCLAACEPAYESLNLDIELPLTEAETLKRTHGRYLDELDRLHLELRDVHDGEADDDTDFDVWVHDMAANNEGLFQKAAQRFIELEKLLDVQ